jgi:hypothetical protein
MTGEGAGKASKRKAPSGALQVLVRPRWLRQIAGGGGGGDRVGRSRVAGCGVAWTCGSVVGTLGAAGAALVGAGVVGASSGAGAVWIGTATGFGGSITGAGAASAGEEADGAEVDSSFFGAAARRWCVVVDVVFSAGAAGAAATGSVVAGTGTATLAAVVGVWSGVTIGVGGVIASDAPSPSMTWLWSSRASACGCSASRQGVLTPRTTIPRIFPTGSSARSSWTVLSKQKLLEMRGVAS